MLRHQKTMQATDNAAATAKASGMVTIEVNTHLFRKGEENGFCEWFGCEFISVIGLIEGRNLIELHYSEKETVFVGFNAIGRVGKGVYFCAEIDNDFEFVAQIYKVARFVLTNCDGVLSVKAWEF